MDQPDNPKLETGCGPRALHPRDSEGPAPAKATRTRRGTAPCGDATSSALVCQAALPGPEHAWRLAGQTTSSAFLLRDRRLGDGAVGTAGLRRERLA